MKHCRVKNGVDSEANEDEIMEIVHEFGHELPFPIVAFNERLNRELFFSEQEITILTLHNGEVLVASPILV